MNILTILFTILPCLVMCYKIKYISNKNKSVNYVPSSFYEIENTIEKITDYTIPNWVYEEVFKYNKHNKVKKYEKDVSKYVNSI